MNRYSVFLPMLSFCVSTFAQFFADTTLVIEKTADIAFCGIRKPA